MAEPDAVPSLLPKERHNSLEKPPTTCLSISAKEWHPTAVPAASGTQNQPPASTQLQTHAAGFTPASSPAQGALDHRLPPEHQSSWQNDGWQNDGGSSYIADQVPWQDDTETAVAHLAQFFPEYGTAALAGVLKGCAGDVWAAANELMQLEAEVQQQCGPSGDEALAQQGTSRPSLDDLDFPSLSISGDAAASTTSKSPISPAPPSQSTSLWTSSWASGTADLKQRLQQPPELAPGGATRSPSAAARRSGPQPAVPSAARGPGGSSTDGDGSEAAGPWVATGAAVSRQYEDVRQEARELALARNQYFQQATLAYQSGNKALAKELGAKGRAANEAMHAAHAAAAAHIFQRRNAAHGSQRGPASSGAAFVDLHGLHVAEALRVMVQQLARLRPGGSLQVLVGTGHHTKGAKTPARLPIAVEEFLRQRGRAVRQLQPGLLAVS